MNKLSVTINKVQHLARLHFEVDLEVPRLLCLTGRNGTGKTTLVKALRNLANADTFSKTTVRAAFSPESSIVYNIDDVQIEFRYNKDLGIVDCKEPIPDSIRNAILAELPLPYGERFNFFQRISNADDDIRRAIILQQYREPVALKDFLRNIYGNNKFDRLIEIPAKGASYYCILLDDDRYIREDYLSSGEYFVIALFRRLSAGQRLVIVDELDISLDAAAQVQLVAQLRRLCQTYGSSLVFTTHSLALMKKLAPGELFHIESEGSGGNHGISCISFNHVNALLFGFIGSDKYILTEDEMLGEYISYLISSLDSPIFFSHKIIFIGSANDTVSLMKRNAREKFFAGPEDVITILDGDKSKTRLARVQNVHFLPFASVEKAFLLACLRGEINIPPDQHLKNACDLADLHDFAKAGATAMTAMTEGQFGKIAKTFVRIVTGEEQLLTQRGIFAALTAIHSPGVETLRQALGNFLCQPPRIDQLQTPDAAGIAGTAIAITAN